MSCAYWQLTYCNSEYGIYPGDPEMIHQGYCFAVGDFFESLSCALAINGIGKRPETLYKLSPVGDCKKLEDQLGVAIRVINIQPDSWMLHGIPVFTADQIMVKDITKHEIYIGVHQGIYYTISTSRNADRANLCAWLFAVKGRWIQ